VFDDFVFLHFSLGCKHTKASESWEVSIQKLRRGGEHTKASGSGGEAYKSFWEWGKSIQKRLEPKKREAYKSFGESIQKLLCP
jgi:hypothetical protein